VKIQHILGVFQPILEIAPQKKDTSSKFNQVKLKYAHCAGESSADT
jgi:hypothetical protein